MPVTSSIDVTLRDGSTFTHKAVFTRRISRADDPALTGNNLVVEAICCKDESTRSRHTLPDDVSTYSTDQIDAEILAHVQRVATRHASAHKVKDYADNAAKPAPPAPVSTDTP